LLTVYILVIPSSLSLLLFFSVFQYDLSLQPMLCVTMLCSWYRILHALPDSERGSSGLSVCWNASHPCSSAGKLGSEITLLPNVQGMTSSSLPIAHYYNLLPTTNIIVYYMLHTNCSELMVDYW